MKKLNLPSKLNPKIILPLIITLILGFLGGLGYSSYSVSKQSQLPTQATVIKVTDGDTLELDSGKTLRLYGINCPEKDQSYYQEAKDFTQSKVLNKKVALEYEPKYEQDKFGRLLGYVIFPNSPNEPNNSNLPNNLNIALVRQGFCQPVIYQKRAKLIYQDELLEAEKQAKEEKLNLWSK